MSKKYSFKKNGNPDNKRKIQQERAMKNKRRNLETSSEVYFPLLSYKHNNQYDY